MDRIAVMIGLGQLARAFAAGLLRTGHMVAPALRRIARANGIA